MDLCLPGLALANQLYLAVQAQGYGRKGTQALMLALGRFRGSSGRGRGESGRRRRPCAWSLSAPVRRTGAERGTGGAASAGLQAPVRRDEGVAGGGGLDHPVNGLAEAEAHASDRCGSHLRSGR